ENAVLIARRVSPSAVEQLTAVVRYANRVRTNREPASRALNRLALDEYLPRGRIKLGHHIFTTQHLVIAPPLKEAGRFHPVGDLALGKELQHASGKVCARFVN